MGKVTWKPGTLLNPVPLVMVTCGDFEKSNIITLAWAGTINSEPPMVSISVRKERFSYDLLKETKQFAINLVNKKLSFAADFCGVKSGKDLDKFSEMKLTKEKASLICAPLIKESPVSLECEVTNCLELGSHDMFLAKIVAVNVDETYIDNTGKLHLDKAELVCYSHGKYYMIENALGFFGYSVAKKEVLDRRK